MKLRIRIAAVVLASVASAAQPAAADTYTTYKLSPGSMSPLYSHGGCHLRVGYGNFGSAPFAIFEQYPTSTTGCGNASIRVWWADSSGTHLHPNAPGWDAGQHYNSCGYYNRMQSTWTAGPGYATGVRVRWADGAREDFMYNGTTAKQAIGYCKEISIGGPVG